jgi:hypothetical protein
MRQLMMTVIALTAFAAMVVTAQADSLGGAPPRNGDQCFKTTEPGDGRYGRFGSWGPCPQAAIQSRATAPAPRRQTAHPSQAVSGATVYCIGGIPEFGQLNGRCYNDWPQCAKALGSYYSVGQCWSQSPTARPPQTAPTSRTALASSAPATCTGLKSVCLSYYDHLIKEWSATSKVPGGDPLVIQLEQNRPNNKNFCNSTWDQCMKTGFWEGANLHRSAERR